MLGIVSPTLRDDPDSPSTSPHVDNQSGRYCSQSAESVGGWMLHLHRFGVVSTSTPSSTVGKTCSDLQLMSLPYLAHAGDKNTHVLRKLFKAIAQLVNLPLIGLQ